MIKDCLKWQDGSVFGDQTNLYIARLSNGKVYCYNKREGWIPRTDLKKDMEFNDRDVHDPWQPCSPLEAVVVCGTKGLE